MHRPTFALVLAFFLSLWLDAPAFAKPVVQLHLQGAIVARGADGSEVLGPLVDAELQPGSVVRYALVAANVGADPASKLISEARVPQGTQFANAAPSTAARIEFSLDGGKTWAARPLIKIATPHGAVERDAPTSSYTALRWIEAAPLAAHRTVTYSYEVRVK